LDIGYESSQTSHSGVRVLRKDPSRCLAVLYNPLPDTGSGLTRYFNAMRALPDSPTGFKGAGKVDRAKWLTAFLLRDLESGDLLKEFAELRLAELEEESS
jgi:hypothetical protein